MAEPAGNKPALPYWMGRHPFEPDKKVPALLTREQSIPRIYGKGNRRISTHLHISTDKITCTEFRVAPGNYFEPPDIHSGDEIYYVREGTATVLNPETGEVLTAKKGDFLLVPKGTWHQTYNFGKEQLVLSCSFAPKVWSLEDGGVPGEFPGNPVHLKGGA